MGNRILRAGLVFLVTWCALAPARSEKTTITYMGWGSPQEMQISRDLLAEFMRRNPDIHVKYIHAPMFEDKLRTMMAGDIPPDVFYMSVGSFPLYAARGTLLNLEPYIARDRFNVKDFFPQLIDGFRYEGSLYGLPKDFTTQVLYYNADLFDRDNVPYPDDTWTWDDFLDAAKKLTHDFDGDGRIDQFGLQYASDINFSHNWFLQAGARRFTPDGERFALNSVQGRRAFQFLHDLDFKHHVTLSASAGAGRDAQAEFSNGRLAMYVGYGRWLVPRFREMN